ncbi:hypothetical protein VHEMI09046 [[Torrubiella] hemipterigena]|uniref:Uncharacterized protein n=1 Tax=[Torrubiella] hemipterigena TaxID=1531966 RepID=A0A0A1TPB0_9HYPO|nr:hypothetical protein VHEMI09046 [[Torrubiella] hemipterigena]
MRLLALIQRHHGRRVVVPTVTNFCNEPVYVNEKEEAGGTVLKTGEVFVTKIKSRKGDNWSYLCLTASKESPYGEDPITFRYSHASCPKFINGQSVLYTKTKQIGKRWDIGHSGRSQVDCAKPAPYYEDLTMSANNPERDRMLTGFGFGSVCESDYKIGERIRMTLRMCSENAPSKA